METPIRALIVVAVVVAALAVGWVLRRVQRPFHAPVDFGDEALPAGIVIFTSTDCANCKPALEVVKGTGLPVREITYELEPQRFEQMAIEAVPLVVVTDRQGRPVGTLVGVPRRRRLRRLIEHAGW